MTAPLSVGMDIGGTKTAALVLDGAGRIGASVHLPTERGDEGVLRTAERALAVLAERTGCRVADFAGVGVGVPGQVDRERGEVRHAYNIEEEALALAPLLSARAGTAVSVDNDVTAAAVGAAHLLGLRGSVAYLNLGTGLAAGIVLDGAPWRGAHGLAGEIGHLPIDERGRPCPCGQRGCLETVASGSALTRYWPAGGEHPGRRIRDAVAQGDPVAREALDLLVGGAAAAIRVLGLTLAPDAVVIGGGLRKIGAPLVDGIRERLDAWADASPLLAELRLGARSRGLPDGSPAATVGAALAPRV